jgi:hypothetical protein
MRAATIKVLLVSLLSLALQHAHAKAGRGSDCLLHPAKKRVVYCESIPIGSVALAAQNFTGTALISFDSNFFSGLERLKKGPGPEFRKAGHRVLNYPDEFTLAIEPLPPVRLPGELRPRRVIVRWLDVSQHVLAEKTTDLEEVEEWWPELAPPKVWYRTRISGVNEPLISGIEILVTGDGGAVLGTMGGNL